MTSLRFYFRIAGGHVRVRVFSARQSSYVHAMNGQLVFDFDEWTTGGVQDALSRIGEVLQEV